MTAVFLLGAMGGLGLYAALRLLVPGPRPLARALADLEETSLTDSTGQGAPGLGRILAKAAGADRWVGPGLAADLAVAGHDATWFAAWAVLLGGVGLAFGPVLWIFAWAAGTALPPALPVGASLLGAAGCAGAHLLSVRSEAARRRGEFSFALSGFLDLVVVSMAAGRGVEGALSVASESGAGWAFEALHSAMVSARLAGQSPWVGLDELGRSWGLPELRGLASSIELAGASGAKVRASVAARARALRLRGVSDARAAAESATERMSVPVVLLVIGFLLLIGYPAVVQITTRI